MKRLTCNIIIGDFKFTYVNEVSINSTWEEFTDTAIIRLPTKLEFNGQPLIAGSNSLFKRGDNVEIWLGYDFDLKREFIGFIADVKPSLPFEIRCEDILWKLKQTNFTKSYKTVDLKTLISDVIANSGVDAPFEAEDIDLGKFRITNANAVEVFEELKNTYGIITFAQQGKIYSGLPYKKALQEVQNYNLEINVADSNGLTYSRADDKKIKVKAISIYPDNTKEEIEFGDTDGEQRTFNFYDVPKKDLEETAKRELERIKIDGYIGSFTAFGVPYIEHNDVASISSQKTPERQGEYLIKGVETTFGVNGFRRVIKLDRKV
jgi:hypothetical protein